MDARTITLDGPGKNALGTSMMRHIRRELDAAGGAPVLLTGAGDAFSAGLDLKEVAGLDRAGMEVFLRELDALVRALWTYPGPTVALVGGHAIAGGAVLTLCCDWRVVAANPKLKIGLNEVALGLRFPPVVLRAVRARVPEAHHTRVLLEAGLWDGETARALGLVDEVAGDAPAAARAALERLARHPAVAYAATKADLRGDLAVPPDEERRFVEQVVPTWTSPELKERLLAVLKR